MEAAKAGWYGSDWFLSFLTLPRAPVLDKVEAAAGQFRLRLGCFVPCAALGVAGMQACSMTCSRQIRAQVSFSVRLCFSHPVTMHSVPFHIPLWFYVLLYLFRLCPVGLLFMSCSYVQTIYIQLRGMAQGAPCSPELLPPILHDASGLESHSTLAFWTVFRQESHSEELPLQGLHFLVGMLLYPEKKNSCRPTSNLVKPVPSAVAALSLSSREELDLCFLVLRYTLEDHMFCSGQGPSHSLC